jgi:hypothetical protein
MSVSKKINTGNYTIDTNKYGTNPDGNVTIITNTITIDGNLVVVGNTANVQAFDTINPIIKVNASKTSIQSPTSGYSGLENVRGTEPNVGLYWDEDGTNAGEWVANNGSNIGPLLTSFNVKLDKTTDNPLAVGDYVVVTASNVDVGGTGLFVNAGSASTELVSVQTARKFAIIFG